MKIRRFTLIELLIVIAIIAILFSMMIPSFRKAKKASKLTACLSNLKQLSTASIQCTLDNNQFFPSKGRSNEGYRWFGKDGGGITTPTVGYVPGKVTERPVNAYLGYTQDGQKVPLTECPLEDNSQIDWVKHNGTSYMAAARTEHANDLDGAHSRQRLSKIQSASRMVMIAEPGAWCYAYLGGGNIWSANNHGANRFSIAFVDGHVQTHGIAKDIGIVERSQIDFTNEAY